jgi:hypothetical protein
MPRMYFHLEMMHEKKEAKVKRAKGERSEEEVIRYGTVYLPNTFLSVASRLLSIPGDNFSISFLFGKDVVAGSGSVVCAELNPIPHRISASLSCDNRPLECGTCYHTDLFARTSQLSRLLLSHHHGSPPTLSGGTALCRTLCLRKLCLAITIRTLPQR